MNAMRCATCNAPLPPPPWYRADTCSACGQDLHACVQCAHHDPAKHNGCNEPQADRVVDKERANFCDWFRAAGGGGGDEDPAKRAALAALDGLFKK